MRIYDTGFAARLNAARDEGIAPVWFFWVIARDDAGDDSPMGFWSGDEDITLSVESPGGGSASRTYTGGCGLRVEGLQYVGDLTDNPVSVVLSQIAPAAQELLRGLDVRLAYCEIHTTARNGGSLISAPQLQWVGIVDQGPITTPAVGGQGGISLSVRSEIMTQLSAINPAKSSDEHQRRRAPGDDFCKFASTISSRNLQWFKS